MHIRRKTLMGFKQQKECLLNYRYIYTEVTTLQLNFLQFSQIEKTKLQLWISSSFTLELGRVKRKSNKRVTSAELVLIPPPLEKQVNTMYTKQHQVYATYLQKNPAKLRKPTSHCYPQFPPDILGKIHQVQKPPVIQLKQKLKLCSRATISSNYSHHILPT